MVAAVAMVKDEADVIAQTVGAMAAQVDLILIADNGSTDGTREALENLSKYAANPKVDLAEIVVLDDSDPAYFQSRKMTALAAQALERGADWIVPFDADEIWRLRVGGPTTRIAGELEALPAEAVIAEAVVLDHVATPDGLGWRRREAVPLRKVACRALPGLTIQQGNHGATFEGVAQPLTRTGILEVRHFPYRSPAQFIRKVRNGAAAYAATDLPESYGKHWRDYGRTLERGGEAALEDHFRRWFYVERPSEDPDLIFDPCPALN